MDYSKKREFLSEHARIQALLYLTADLLAVVSSGVVAYLLLGGDPGIPVNNRVAILIGVFLTVFVFYFSGMYVSWRGRSVLDQLRDASVAWAVVFASMIAVGLLLGIQDQVARNWVLLWFLSALVFLSLFRASVNVGLRLLRKRGWNHKRVLVVGTGDWSQQVIRRINESSWSGFDVCGLVHDEVDIEKEFLEGAPILGNFHRLPDLVKEMSIDEVWICLPVYATSDGVENKIDQVLHTLRHCTVTQRLIPGMAELRFMNRPITEIMGMPALNLNSTPMAGLNRLMKGLEDRLISALVLFLVSPVLLVIALLIKVTTKGPVLYTQLRHGWDGKVIRIYKFRTMVAHDESKDWLEQAERGDGRVTPVGSFLRRTSLDELPQFYNVLQGRMSVVGPRPHAISHNEYYMNRIDSYMQRHKVKPGITGWAQINGWRGATQSLDKMKKRVEFDLYYIDNWSLWFDLKIIAMTVFKGFVHKNAY